MSLRIRIIACLDIADGRVVKGVNFVDLRDAGDPIAVARHYDQAGADELCLLDISATHQGRGTLLAMVEKIAAVCFMPMTVGGGIRNLADARALFCAGADKIAVNSAAVAKPSLITTLAEHFGSQSIVASIDARQSAPDCWEIYTHGGRRPTGINACDYARRMAALGAGELLVTSMDRDGTKQGYDLALTRAIADAVALPVIASGGVGCLEDLVDGVREGGAHAVLVASLFHFGEATIAQAQTHLAAAGLPTRTPRPCRDPMAVID